MFSNTQYYALIAFFLITIIHVLVFTGAFILHGALKNAFLGHLMTDFAGNHGWLKKLGVQYRGMDQPGSKVVCKGRVSKKYVEGGHHMVDCEIWLENAKGEKTTPGTATVVLPSKNVH